MKAPEDISASFSSYANIVVGEHSNSKLQMHQQILEQQLSETQQLLKMVNLDHAKKGLEDLKDLRSQLCMSENPVGSKRQFDNSMLESFYSERMDEEITEEDQNLKPRHSPSLSRISSVKSGSVFQLMSKRKREPSLMEI